MLPLLIIAILMLGSAAVAMLLRNLVHSALLLVLSWASIAVFYLWAGAEFAAFAQLIVYVGAVSMIVLFAVLLTRPPKLADLAVEKPALARVANALLAGGAVAGVMTAAVLSAEFDSGAAAPPVVTVREIGVQLMGPQAAALLVVGVILTVALLGAVVIAATEPRRGKGELS
jgi:NADH:ubiquinone oxidoreductase subunit 6 (subunit J)